MPTSSMVAMSMVCMPEFLILDELTTALDVTTQIEVLKAIGDVIRQKGSGAIYVSHDLAVVAQIADYIVVMNGGRIVEEESPDSYKDVHGVARVSHEVGLAERVMMSTPIAVAKG